MGHDNEPSVRDFVEVLRSGLLPALLVAALFAAATYYLSSLRPPVYQSQATVVTTTQDPAQRDFGTTLVTAPALATTTYRAAVLSRDVLTTAWHDLEGQQPTADQLETFRQRISVRSEDALASALLRITATAHDPQVARLRADAVANALVRWDVERATRALENIIASLEAQIVAIEAETAAAEPDQVAGLERARTELALQLSSARALRTGAVGRVELFETASAPRRPFRPTPLRDALLAAVLAVILVFGLVLLRAALDARIRSLDELVAVTGAPVMAVFPPTRGGRHALSEEAASYLRTGLVFATADVHPKVLMLTSAKGGQGKTSVALALAKAFARQFYKTLLIDADLRNPSLAAEFGLRPTVVTSLPEALVQAVPIKPARIRLGSEHFLEVLPTFEPTSQPTELLSTRMGPLLERIRDDYDVIIIDSAPVLPVADTLTIAPLTTGVVLVANMLKGDRQSVVGAIGLFRQLGIRVLGTVANQVPANRSKMSAYGYGYGPTERAAQVPSEAP